jgi:hypothetical protein
LLPRESLLFTDPIESLLLADPDDETRRGAGDDDADDSNDGDEVCPRGVGADKTRRVDASGSPLGPSLSMAAAALHRSLLRCAARASSAAATHSEMQSRASLRDDIVISSTPT